jgi:ATP-dependent Clp protease adaptor protein ClpS
VGRQDTKEDVAVKQREKAVTPKRYRVILFNDDYTTMEFVVQVLEAVFKHGPSSAYQIMMKVHKEGRGVAGVYPHEVAETKVLTVHELARTAGYPLRAGLEEE